MRKLAIFIGALGFAVTAASAHDLWLQPASFRAAPGATVPTAILIGHGADRENWGVRSDRILLLRSIAPDGTRTDLKPLLRPGAAPSSMPLRFAGPGTHTVAMQTSHSESVLPGPRFNEYAEEEGLTPAITERARAGTSGQPGREIYSRRAKTLVQVGPAQAATAARATVPLGLELEIVPERNPYMLRGAEPLPIRVFYQGRPLAGALVKLTNLDADDKPVAMHRTNRSGRASFAVPKSGKWLLNVIWTKPISGNPTADFDTTFSSLTFGYSDEAAAQ